MTLKEIREKQARLVAEARSKLDAVTDSTDSARAQEIEREHDTIMAEHDRLEERAKREERLNAAENVINQADPRRPIEDLTAGDPIKKPEDAENRSKAFKNYLRGGLEGCTQEERSILRAMTSSETRDQVVGTAAQGGYTVPTDFMAELIKSLKLWGPMLDPGVTRQLATDTGRPLPWPTMNDTGNKGRRITEDTQINITGAGGGAAAALGFGQVQFNAWKYTSDAVLVSSELLQDSALDIEEIVRDAMAERIGRIANSDLTIGTGSGASMPMGISVGAGAGVNAGADNIVVWDDILNLYHAVDPAYRKDPSCGFMFNDQTLLAIRKLKDGDGNYIWQPASVVANAPATILGEPYHINQDMGGMASTNVSVIFGAFNKYLVRRVREFALKRLTERYADYDAVGFIGFMRMDGNILDNRAIQKLTHP